MELEKYTVVQLKAALRHLELPTSGLKRELMLRLQEKGVNDLSGEMLETVDDNEDELDGKGQHKMQKLEQEMGALRKLVETLTQQLSVLSAPQITFAQPRSNSPERGQRSVETSQESTHQLVGSMPNPESNNLLILSPSAGCIDAQQFGVVGRACGMNGTFGHENNDESITVDVAARANVLEGSQRQIVASSNDAQMSVTTSTATIVTNTIANANMTTRISPEVLGFGNSEGQATTSAGVEARNKTKYHVRDIIDILPEFDPIKSDISSLKFIERVEQLKLAYDWDEKLVIFAVLSNLKGVAKLWADSQPVYCVWKYFVETFLNDFPCTINTADLHMQMMQARVGKNESVIEFYYRLLAIGKRGNLEENAIICYIVNGVNDSGLKKILSAMHFAKCADLLQTLINLQSSDQKTATATAFVQHNNIRNPNFEKAKDETEKSEARVSGSGPVCYRCRERGHIAKNCSQQSKKPRENTINVIKEPKSERAASEIMKDILISGVACKVLIDSGSSWSLLKRKIAEKCSGEISACQVQLQGFAGGKHECREALQTSVAIDGEQFLCKWLVVDDHVMAYDAIVGRNILCKMCVVIQNGECQTVPVTELCSSENLSTIEKDKLQALLNKYAGCFGEKLQDLGKCKRFKMDIVLKSNKPVFRKPYAIPIPKQTTVEQIINELLELEIVRINVRIANSFG